MLYYWQIVPWKLPTLTQRRVWRLACAQARAWSKCDLYCNKNKLHIKSKCVTPKLVYNSQKRVENKVAAEMNTWWNANYILMISSSRNTHLNYFYCSFIFLFFSFALCQHECMWLQQLLKTAVQWGSAIFVLVILYPLTTNHSSITTVF